MWEGRRSCPTQHPVPWTLSSSLHTLGYIQAIHLSSSKQLPLEPMGSTHTCHSLPSGWHIQNEAGAPLEIGSKQFGQRILRSWYQENGLEWECGLDGSSPWCHGRAWPHPLGRIRPDGVQCGALGSTAPRAGVTLTQVSGSYHRL